MRGWLEVGTDIEQSKRSIALAEEQAGVYATVGIHPSDIASLTPQSRAAIEELADNPKVKAIGEVGLDFYRDTNREQQREALLFFLGVAREQRLPLVFHVRSGPGMDAHDEILEIISRLTPAARPAGVVHTYSGTAEQARHYLEFGLYISFSGVLTFSNAEAIQQAAAWVPLDRVLIETDCPYLAPAPYRGKRNEPAYVRLVAEKLAEIKQTPIEYVLKKTEENAYRLLNLTQQ
jgi:TatD DNase family protein